MYKTLGRRVSNNPGAFCPLIHKKDKNDWLFVAFFEVKKGKVTINKKVKKVKKIDPDDFDFGVAWREELKEIKRKHKPLYIVIFHKYSFSAPLLVYERGDKKIFERWQQEQGQFSS